MISYSGGKGKRSGKRFSLSAVSWAARSYGNKKILSGAVKRIQKANPKNGKTKKKILKGEEQRVRIVSFFGSGISLGREGIEALTREGKRAWGKNGPTRNCGGGQEEFKA